MVISNGKITKPYKVVIYGPEGIGKSTFAAQFPDPVFIDTENSTTRMDVARIEYVPNWGGIEDAILQLCEEEHNFKTLVIDTADWAELMCIKQVCKDNKVNSIENIGYGKGYTFLMEYFKKLLEELDLLLQKRQMNIVFTAHAKMRKFEQPDELGAYDRWEMKLSKQVAPMLKEWADMVLFANYKTDVVKTTEGSRKAQGGKRIIYTRHHPCWDAKNRDNLPETIPLEYSAIKGIIEPKGNSSTNEPEKAKEEPKTGAEKPLAIVELRKLMEQEKFSDEDVLYTLHSKGKFTEINSIDELDDLKFVKTSIIGAWDRFANAVKKTLAKEIK